MRISKFFSGVFGLLGLALAAGTVWLSLHSLNAAPVLVFQPEAAEEQAQALMTAVEKGDYTTAGNLMYGCPDLGADHDAADRVGQLIWSVFQRSFDYEFTGEFYATDSGVARDVKISALDISGVTENWGVLSQNLLTQRMEQAEDMSEIYDENNEYREDFVMDVLYDAVLQALGEDAEYIEQEITLNMVYEQGQWWIVPDHALLQAISGGVSN